MEIFDFCTVPRFQLYLKCWYNELGYPIRSVINYKVHEFSLGNDGFLSEESDVYEVDEPQKYFKKSNNGTKYTDYDRCRKEFLGGHNKKEYQYILSCFKKYKEDDSIKCTGREYSTRIFQYFMNVKKSFEQWFDYWGIEYSLNEEIDEAQSKTENQHTDEKSKTILHDKKELGIDESKDINKEITTKCITEGNKNTNILEGDLNKKEFRRDMKKKCKDIYIKLLNTGQITVDIEETKVNHNLSKTIIIELEKEYKVTDKNKRSISDYFRKYEITAKRKNGKYEIK